MKVNKKTIKANSIQEFYEIHFGILNALMPVKFTDKELKILASFMSVDKQLVEDDRFNTLVRKKVMAEHKLSAGGLANHIKAMIDKGFLERSKVTRRIRVKEFLLPDVEKQGYMILLEGIKVQGVHNGEAAKTVLKETKEKVVTREATTQLGAASTNKLAQNFSSEEESTFSHSEMDFEEDDDEDEVPYKMTD